MVIVSPLPAQMYATAEDTPKGQNALRKLGRGAANVVFGIAEVPNQYSSANAQGGASAAIGYGIPKGIVRWFGRELVGVYEIVTFPLPLPRGYKPIMKPEWPEVEYEP
jgi:putative exosortase-associated protein (TIGR04073 family)